MIAPMAPARTAATPHAVLERLPALDGIAPADAAQRVGDRFSQRGTRLGEHGDLTADQVATILLQC